MPDIIYFFNIAAAFNSFSSSDISSENGFNKILNFLKNIAILDVIKIIRSMILNNKLIIIKRKIFKFF